MTTELEHFDQHPANADTPTLGDLLDAAIIHADTQRAELAEQGDLDGLAWGLTELRDLRNKLAQLISQTDADVSRLNREHGNNHTVDGLGALETKRRSTRTQWDSEALYGRLIDRITARAVSDPDTGEIVGDANTAARMATLLREVLAPCLQLTASGCWRIGGIKHAGLDPERYRTRELGQHTTVIIRPEGVSR